MHTLYTFPFACSFAVHIGLERLAVPFEITWVDRGYARKIMTNGFDALNPKRKVPALVLPDGEVLTEMVAVLDWLDEQGAPRTALRRRRHLEWASFIATELHQQVLGPAFDPATPEAGVEDARNRLLPPVLAHLEAAVVGRGTLLDTPSPADDFLYWATRLLAHRWPETVQTPGLQALLEQTTAQPPVRTALRREVEALAAARAASPQAS